MKKSVIAIWIIAALFFVCSFPLFTQGDFSAGVCGIVIAAVLVFVGYRKHKKSQTAHETAAEILHEYEETWKKPKEEVRESPSKRAESDFPFSMSVEGGTIGVRSTPECKNSASMPKNDEEAAIKYIFSALEEGGVDVSTLFFDRTAEYLKIVSDKIYQLCFCRVKMFGQSRYIELTISAKDAKLYADDPRFNGINLAGKRFTRIPISSAEDIPQYADVIRLAYTWGTTTA